MLRTVTPILSILLAILLYLFFVQPHYEDITLIRKDRDDHRKAVQGYTEFNAKLEQLIAAKDNTSSVELERLNEFIPDTIDTAMLLVKLERLARTSNLLFGNITAEVATEKELTIKKDDEATQGTDPELVSADISFSVIGTYPQFKNFLRDLESSLTLFEITEIGLEGSSDSAFQQYSFTVRSYALSAPK